MQEQPMLFEGLRTKVFRPKREILRKRTIKDDGAPILIPKKVLRCKDCEGQMTVCEDWGAETCSDGVYRVSTGAGFSVRCEFHDYQTVKHRPHELLEYMEALGLVREWLVRYIRVKE